jgi:hypothetical protein
LHSQICNALLVCCVLQILAYLEAFADAFDLRKHIKLNTTVVRVDPLVDHSAAATAAATAADETPDMTGEAAAGRSSKDSSSCSMFPLAPGQQLKWKVVTNCSGSCSSQSSSTPSAGQHAAQTGTSITKADFQEQHKEQQQQQQQQQEWVFDAVAVCVGIFSEPNLPQVRQWSCLQCCLNLQMMQHACGVAGGVAYTTPCIALRAALTWYPCSVYWHSTLPHTSAPAVRLLQAFSKMKPHGEVSCSPL